MSNPISSLPLVTRSGAAAPSTALQGKTVAFYFSAHWCPPCRGFTPVLKKFYETVKAKGENIEIVFVSGDRDEDAFKNYFQNEHGDWLAVKYGSQEIDKLNSHFKVQGIPALIVVETASGKAAIPDARSGVASSSSESGMMATFAEWKKVNFDWRDTAGATLGGSSQPAATDAAAMRAARLARLGGGYNPPVAPSAPNTGYNPPVAPSAPNTGQAANASVPESAPVPTVTPGPTSAPTTASEHSPALDKSPGAAPEVDAEKLKQLTEMGFSKDACTAALSATDGNVESAMELLLASAD